MRQIINDQFSIKQNIKNLIKKMWFILKNIIIDEKLSIRKYSCVA
jgi:hypothetical protein